MSAAAEAPARPRRSMRTHAAALCDVYQLLQPVAEKEGPAVEASMLSQPNCSTLPV